jgi:hypothetical protein
MIAILSLLKVAKKIKTLMNRKEGRRGVCKTPLLAQFLGTQVLLPG